MLILCATFGSQSYIKNFCNMLVGYEEIIGIHLDSLRYEAPRNYYLLCKYF
jgi:hypothetical protein